MESGMKKEQSQYDAIIIGGGFYGLRIALYLAEELAVDKILVLEKEPEMMSRASYVNQARVHNGYHYPRSILTGYRSAVNFPDFVKEYKEAVVNDFDKYYSIARQFSKVNARQFVGFCKKIGVQVDKADPTIEALFNQQLTEGVYKVQEYAFDSHKLRDALLKRIAKCSNIEIRNNVSVERVESCPDKSVAVYTDSRQYSARQVLNCTYSRINTLHRASGLPLVALKHEVTEMCLVKLPSNLKDFSVTVMDGPFFSIMPFPSRGLHTLSHVRYTPHESWTDDKDTAVDRHDTHDYFKKLIKKSNYRQIYADVVRYIPALKSMEYADSIREVKTVLVKSEDDDSRPILFKPHFGMQNYTCIMGGKLDNIYDVFEELVELYGKK
jgi:glycine/D-amino acid oxidase-like deaminating enzyme